METFIRSFKMLSELFPTAKKTKKKKNRIAIKTFPLKEVIIMEIMAHQLITDFRSLAV